MDFSDKQFRTLLDSVADPTVIMDASGEIVFASTLVKHAFDYHPSELIGMPIETLLPVRYRQDYLGHWQAYFDDSSPKPIGIGLAHCALRKNGSEIPVEVSIHRFQIGEDLLVSAAIRDVSTRETLSEQRFRAIFEQRHQLAGIVSLDGTLLEANETSLSMVGACREDVIGQPFWDTPWWNNFPQQQKRLRAAILSAARGEIAEFAATHPRPDGSLVLVAFSIRPIVNQKGDILFLVAESHDVTEQTHTEERAKSFGEVLEASINEIYLFDESSMRFLHVNQGARDNLGYSMEELRKLTPVDLKPEFTRELLEAALEPLRNNDQETIDFTTTHRRKNGTYYPVEVHVQRATFDATPVYAAIVLDISERKRAEDALQQSHDLLEQRVNDRTLELAAAIEEADKANVVKTRFLAAASHDLRQPLQSIGLYLSVMHKRSSTESELINKMQSSIRVMGELLDALLDISKLDAGSLTPEIRDFAVQELLDNLVADNKPHSDEKGLQFRCDAVDCVLRSDPALLQRILENFVGNALRYTEMGVVSVRCVIGSNSATIEVSDTGIGIPAEAMETIFEEYYQLDNPVRDRRKGLGLGLAIVKHIALLLDHRLDVRSTPGRGSTFSIEVPLGQAVEMSATANTVATTSPRRTSPVVLIVDDDPAIVDATTMLLESEDIEVYSALDGNEALDRISAGLRPDILISDYRLPGITGVEVIRRLRQKTVNDLPSILMTGDTSAEDIKVANLTNCTVLHKPVDTDHLLSLIDQFTP